LFTPPQVERTTLQMPGFLGAVNWGGVSVDPHRQLLVVNSNRIATKHRLIPRESMPAEAEPGYQPQIGVPYGAHVSAFLSPLGIPCSQPPYGMLTAIDMKTQETRWEKPLGTARDSGPLGIPIGLPLEMGVPNIGGSVVTAGGLIFIAATQEQSIRAINLESGKLLWSARLPAGGQATPMTYRSAASGRQFVVVAAGGKWMLNTRVGDYLVAYALPQEKDQ
jgi:quinoprotein glucose dehydrogenase